MIKRALDRRFRRQVLALVKNTTIRDKVWPVGVPIMLYHWTGAAYRSKHENFAVVVVEEATPVVISRYQSGEMHYLAEPQIAAGLLWRCEGFSSQQAMDEWFSAKLKAGQHVTKFLMRFRLRGKEGH